MLLVYSSASLLPSVLYPPRWIFLPPSLRAPSQLSAHCTTKSWSQGCGIRASPLMCVCCAFFFFYFFPRPFAMSPSPTSPSHLDFFLNTTKQSRETGTWEWKSKVERESEREQFLYFRNTTTKVWNNCTCSLQLHNTQTGTTEEKSICIHSFFYGDEPGELT